MEQKCCKINSYASKGYVLIEDINLNFHKYHHSPIFRRFLYFYRRRIRRKSDANGNYSVKIFIASGERIDNKINKINCRLNKKITKS